MADPTTVPICVIYGPSVYGRREALRRVLDRELQGADESINLVRLDGGRIDAAQALDEVRTFSLMGGRRVVIVEDADVFVKKYRPVLERYAAAPADSGCLVLLCSNFDARTRLYKTVRKIGESIECKPVKGQALIAWLISTAKDGYGKRLGRQAAGRLQEHVGATQAMLDLELSKLACYVGDRAEITVDDVDSLVGHYREQTVFAVMDAIADGDAQTALCEWQQVLLTDRAAPGRAVAGLAWGVRRLLEARRLLDAGTPAFALAKRFWTDPDTLTRRLERATVPNLEDRLADLLQADLDSKTGLASVPEAVEKLIVRQSIAAQS